MSNEATGIDWHSQLAHTDWFEMARWIPFESVCEWAAQIALSRQAETQGGGVTAEALERIRQDELCGAPPNMGHRPEDVQHDQTVNRICDAIRALIGEQSPGANPQEGEDDPFGPLEITEADRDDLSFLKCPTPSRVTVEEEGQAANEFSQMLDEYRGAIASGDPHLTERIGCDLKIFFRNALLASQEDGEREERLLKLLHRFEDEIGDRPVSDTKLWRDYFTETGQHMILTENGWEPGSAKAQYVADLEEGETIDLVIHDETCTPFPNNTVDTEEPNE